jgi:hypothetical protein
MTFLNAHSLVMELQSQQIFSVISYDLINGFGEVQSIQNPSIIISLSTTERFEVINYTTYRPLDAERPEIFLGFRGFYRAYAAEYINRLCQVTNSSGTAKYFSPVLAGGKYISYGVLLELRQIGELALNPTVYQGLPRYPFYRNGEVQPPS